MSWRRRAVPYAALALATVASAQDALPLTLTDDGHAVRRVVQTQSFTLGEGSFEYDYSKEHPSLRSGTLVVLAVDPSYARPRDANMPVLYAGRTPVQIVTQDPTTGCLVGLLAPGVDLSVEPIFYGSTEPPERVDHVRGDAERAAAIAAGFRPRPPAELDAARIAPVLAVHDVTALVQQAKAQVDSCR